MLNFGMKPNETPGVYPVHIRIQFLTLYKAI